MKHALLALLMACFSLFPTCAFAQTPEDVDFDGNQTVDFPDFLKFAATLGSAHPKYDLDGSGTVDFPDFLTFASHFGQPAELRTVSFPDVYLENDIRELIVHPDHVSLSRPYERVSTEPILLQDVREIQRIDRSYYPTAAVGSFPHALNLAGLENLTSLNFIRAGGYLIEDLGPLAGLSHLEYLDLPDNRITDLSPLANLHALSQLCLTNNGVQDVTPLAGLSNLKVVELQENRVRDLTPLTQLVQLTTLKFGYNEIEDVAPLSTLINLSVLRLDGNQIHNIAPLLVNTGLSTDDWVTLIDNPLDEMSKTVYLPDLANRGVIAAPLIDASTGDRVVFADPVLEQKVRNLIDKPQGALTPADVLHVQKLSVQGSSWGAFVSKVVSLVGLEHFPSLTSLAITDGFVHDLAPLANLTGLEALLLRKNRIDDLTPLKDLTALKRLDLAGNMIPDLSALRGLAALEQLYLNQNPIVDLSPLSNLTALKTLELAGTRVTDLTPLLALPALEVVSLTDAPLSDDARGNQIPALKVRGVMVIQ